MAKSPRRRENSRKPQRRCAGHAGRRISVMISSAASARMSGVEARFVLDIAPAHHGAEPHAARVDRDLPQIGKLAQIDQQ
jgi:hypothetical protein